MEQLENLTTYLKYVAIETARMSYPGSMSRGKKPVVCKNTKKALEEYFSTKFPILALWQRPEGIKNDYDVWHFEQVEAISKHIKKYICNGNNGRSVAAKFLNTFMYQLMKYEACRPLYDSLHLPLDRKVFSKLRTVQSLEEHKKLLSKSPYSLKYCNHLKIQCALSNLICNINTQNRNSKDAVTLTSRIQLNFLWL